MYQLAITTMNKVKFIHKYKLRSAHLAITVWLDLFQDTMLLALLEPINHKAANQVALLVLRGITAMVQLFTQFHVQLAITALLGPLNLLLVLLAILVLL